MALPTTTTKDRKIPSFEEVMDETPKKVPSYNEVMGEEVKKKESTPVSTTPVQTTSSSTSSVSETPLSEKKPQEPKPMVTDYGNGEVVNPNDPIGMIKAADDFSKRGKVSVSGGTGGAGASFTPDEKSVKASQEIIKDLEKKGFKADFMAGIKDLPEDAFNAPETSKERLVEVYKENPFRFKQLTNEAKTKYAVRNAAFEEANKNIPEGKDKEYLANQTAIIESNAYSGDDVKPLETMDDLRNVIGKKQESINRNISDEDVKRDLQATLRNTYQSYINPESLNLQEEYENSELKGLVDINQYAGLETLRLFDPAKYDNYLNIIQQKITPLYSVEVNVTPEERQRVNTPDSLFAAQNNGVVSPLTISQKVGQETALRELNAIGLGNAAEKLYSERSDIIAAQNKLIKESEREGITNEELGVLKLQFDESVNQVNNIQAKIGELEKSEKLDDERYPQTAKLKFDAQVKEMVDDSGSNVGEFMWNKFGHSMGSSVDAIENLITANFGSEDDKAKLSMKRIGEGKKFEAKTYLPESERRINSPVIMEFDDGLKKEVKKILNGRSLSDLSQTERDELINVVKNNQDKIKTITNPEEGKSKNFLSKATVMTVAGFTSEIAAFMAKMALLRGAGVGSKLAEAEVLFTDGYNHSVQQKLAEGASMDEANSYGILHGAILSTMVKFGSKFEAVKKIMAGGKSPLSKQIAGMSEETWNAIYNKNKSFIQRAANSAKNVAGEQVKMIGTFAGIAPTADAIADNVFYNADISAGQVAENVIEGSIDMAIGGLPLIGFGLAKGSMKQKATPLEKASLWNLGDQPTMGKLKIDEAVQKGDLTKEEGEVRKKTIDEVSQLIQKVPTKTDKGKLMTDDQRIDYLYNLTVKENATQEAKNLPPNQAAKAEHTAMVSEYANELILDPISTDKLESRVKTLEKQLEAKDEDGKLVLNEKEVPKVKAQLEAVTNELETRKSFEKTEMKRREFVDTKLSEPLEGRDEQGVPIGKDVPPPTETKNVEPNVVGDVVVDTKTKQQLLDERLGKIKEIKDKAEGTREERTKRYNELVSELGDETDALKKLQEEINDRAKKEIDKLPELPKTENEIINEKGESDFNKIKKDLGFKDTDLQWGDNKNPFGEDMGDMLLSKDKDAVIFIKPNEVEVYDAKNDQTDTITNGVKIELVSTKENSRGKGKAKELIQKVTDWADKNGTDLHLDIAPQDKTTTESGLKKLYESFGFEFDGINGIRKPQSLPKEQPSKGGDVVVVKSNLGKRLKGDKLLDAEDLIDELNDNKAEIDNDGMVTVYHRTTPENKAEIERTGKMTGLEDGVFFSTKETGQNEGYGDAIVKLKVPVEKLELDDSFGDEAHLRIPTKKAGDIVNVKDYIPKEQPSLSNVVEGKGSEVGKIITDTPIEKKNTGTEIEPVLTGGRKPVTLTGSTEAERQKAIEQRKKETKQTPMTADRDKILERIGKYNKLNRVQKRSAYGEANSIKLAVDSFNKKHEQKHSITTNRNGDLEFRNNPTEKRSLGRPLKNTIKGEENYIVDNGKPLMERDTNTKKVFNDLLDADVLPVSRRINGEKMSEAEHNATIQDIMDGIPSQRAENYLNSLEKQIKEDNFDFGNPDKNVRTTLNDALNILVEHSEPMTIEKVDTWLKNESELTPEEQLTFDNIDNLITHYEQLHESENGTGRKIQQPNQTGKGTGSSEIKPNEQAEGEIGSDKPIQKVNEEPKATQISDKKEGGITFEPETGKAASTTGEKTEAEVKALIEEAAASKKSIKAKNDAMEAEAAKHGEVGKKVLEDIGEIEPVKESVSTVEGTKVLDKLSNNVPDSGKIAEYMSKETIEKYTGETPTNDQSRGIQELDIALTHGEKIIEEAKKQFGNDYVKKTLDYINNSTASVSNKALMYVSLENALGREKLANPDRVSELTKQQALVYKQSQAFARENSLALNYQRLRKIAQVGYDISKVTDNFFSAEELVAKKGLEKAIEADADTINKEAEFQETAGFSEIVEKQINEGVAKEIEKIYQQLPKEKKTAVDKAIAALESVQTKLRSKTYDATIGIPVAVIDMGITTIKLALKAGVKITDAIELGISKIKEKYGKELEKSREDEIRKDLTEAFSKIKTTKDIVKEALIEKGFGRDINVKGEKKTILDWKKLAGEAGTVSKISENVSEVLKGDKYTEKEITAIKNELINEYIDLRTSVIEKAQNELARRNKETVTPEQKSAAKKLSELYTYGLFEEKAPEFENTLNKALGAKVSEAGYNEAKAIAKGLETLYTASFKGVKLSDVSAKAAIEKLEDRLRVLLFRESKSQGNFALKAASMVRNYFDIQQTMILNNLKQAVENPLSGLQQNIIDKIGVQGTSTPELANQRRKLMKSVYADMMVNGGIGYGKIETTFVNRQHIDDYVNKLSDSKLYHGIASVLTGKATLNTMDAMWKAGITEKKFTNNLIKILTHPTNKNMMGKEDAIKFVSEKLTGQTFKDAQVTAKEIIDKINKDAETELISTNQNQVDRFANDIVKASLEMGGKITPEQITAAYNAAYKSAGLGLGHTANNIVSSMVTDYTAKIEGNINQAIKNKEWNRAAALTYKSILFRNILNPFVGGGTNWLVLKLEKTGLGLFTGLAYQVGSKGKIDVGTELGMRRLEERLYNQARIKDNYMRGLVGGAASLLTYAAFTNLANEDEYRKWRAKNKWAARYLDTITPEYLLAEMAVKDQKVKQYLSTSFNKNDAFDASTKFIKSGEYFVKGDKSKAWGALGEAMGSKINVPLPWRLVKDGQVIYQGATGQDPYHGNYKPSEGFWSGALQGGAIEWLGGRPISATKGDYTPEELKDPTLKTFIDKGINFPELNPEKIPTKEINNEITERLSNYDQATQDLFIKKKKEYLKIELNKLKSGYYKVYVNADGNATMPTEPKDKLGKAYKPFDQLTKKQIQNVISSSISGNVTEKVKKEVLKNKTPIKNKEQ